MKRGQFQREALSMTRYRDGMEKFMRSWWGSRDFLEGQLQGRWGQIEWVVR